MRPTLPRSLLRIKENWEIYRLYLVLDFRVAYMLLKSDLVFATNVSNAIEFSRIDAKKRQSSTRRILHAENQFILATFAYQTRPYHITPHQTIQLGYTKIPLFRVDYCTVYLHDQPSLNTLTILSTPTKLTNLSTLTTDQKGYPEDKCNAC